MNFLVRLKLSNKVVCGHSVKTVGSFGLVQS